MIIVHCSATPPGMDIGVDEIRQWHTDRGWSDIGYHFVITRNGDIQHGRPINLAGAHVKGMNANSIGVCLVGGSNADDLKKSEANFTIEQYCALTDLTERLKKGYGIKSVDIMGHRDVPEVKKDCPCFDVQQLLFGYKD